VKVADFINWEIMLDEDKTPRYSGSHIDQMKNFLVDSDIIASEYDDNYQGHDSMVFLFTPANPKLDPKLIIVTSYFGSCSGCDAWENAKDDDLRQSLVAIANNARVFDSFEDILRFFDEIIEKLDDDDNVYGEYYDLHNHAKSLRKQIEKTEIKLGSQV